MKTINASVRPAYFLGHGLDILRYYSKTRSFEKRLARKTMRARLVLELHQEITDCMLEAAHDAAMRLARQEMRQRKRDMRKVRAIVRSAAQHENVVDEFDYEPADRLQINVGGQVVASVALDEYGCIEAFAF